MLLEIKKGFLWGVGVSVAAVLVFYTVVVIESLFEEPEYEWNYAPQTNMEVSSYTYRIIEDFTKRRVLAVSGEVKGDPAPPVPAVKNHVLVKVEVRDTDGVFLGTCESPISYRAFHENGRRWFDAHCEPPEQKSDIGDIEIKVLHKYQAEE